MRSLPSSTGKGEELRRAACGRRRRTAIALPRRPPGSGSRRRDLHQSALTFNITPFAAAQQHLHRVSHPARAVRVRTLPGNRCSVVWVFATPGSRAADVAQRRRTVGGRRKAVAFHSRPRPGRSRPQRVSADDRTPRADSPAIVSRWSARSAHVVPPIGAPGPQHGTARRRRHRRHRRRGNLARRGSRLAGGAGALPVRPPRRRPRAG